MLRKLVIASATVAAAAGLGLASPAYGDDLVEVNCVGPTFGEETNNATVGDVTAAVTAAGDTLANLIHDESTTEFDYSCGNGAIEKVGNRIITIKREQATPYREYGHHHEENEGPRMEFNNSSRSSRHQGR